MADLVAAVLLWVPFIGLLWYYRRGLADVPADRYTHQLPTGLTPAVVGTLFGARRFAVDSAATTLDLVRRGVLRLERLPTPRAVETGDPLAHDHLLTLAADKVGGLDEIERGLVEFLFRRVGGDSQTVSISQVRHWWHTHQNAGRAQEIWWERRATAAARYYGLVAPRASGSVSAAAYYGAFLCVVSLFLMGQGHMPARLVIFSCGVAMIWLALRLPSLTARGIELRRRYQAFRNYLHDYGRFHEKEAEQIVLWDYYLSYAVTLGLATESLWELFILPPPVGEGTTVRGVEAWLHLRPLPPVWSTKVPDEVIRTQRLVAQALATRRSPAGAEAQSGSSPAAAGAGKPVLPAAPPWPHAAPPPSTYEANVEATKKALTNVALGLRALFMAPFILFAFMLLLIAGCMVAAKLS